MAVSKDQLTTAEAHLYAGIAKADGEVSQREYAQIPYYADRAVRFFQKKQLPKQTEVHLGKKIRSLLRNPAMQAWDSDQHLAAAADILTQAHNEGSWNVKLIFFRNERGFLDTAKIDGYVIKEATYIRKMEETLGEIFEYQEG